MYPLVQWLPHPQPGCQTRGSEGCVIHAGMRRKSWALNVHTLLRSHALNPTLELRVPKMRFLNVSTPLPVQGLWSSSL